MSKEFKAYVINDQHTVYEIDEETLNELKNMNYNGFILNFEEFKKRKFLVHNDHKSNVEENVCLNTDKHTNKSKIYTDILNNFYIPSMSNHQEINGNNDNIPKIYNRKI